MKKEKLLELLATIPDGAEVFLWNGLVGDWVDFGDVKETMLSKMTRTTMREMCRLEQCHDLKNWDFQFSPEELAEIDSCYRRNYKWEFNRYVTQQDVDEKRYSVKTIYLVDAKIKGESTYDRAGSIEY